MNLYKSIGTTGLSAVIFLSCSQLSWGQGEITIVSPASAERVEGDSKTNFGQPAPAQVQNLFPAEDFLALPESHRTITGLTWRQDESTRLTALARIPITLTLSATTADTLVPTFAENHGDDKTVVFDSEIIWQSNDTGPGPRSFDVFVPFEETFPYNPSEGMNLVLDLVATTAGSHQFQLDAHRTEGITWQAAHDSSISSFPREFVWVTQFTFVPEPSTFFPCCSGLILLLAWRNPSRSDTSRSLVEVPSGR